MDINRDTLKEYLEKGDRPTQEQFEDLVDSLINKVDDQVHVVGSKLYNNAQIGLGEHRDPNDLPVGGLELVRLYVDKRVSVKQLKIRGDAPNGPNVPSQGKLLFAKDNTGNTEWRDQTQLDQNHWRRADFTPNSLMYAVPLGNIGIGTQSPSAKLHVFGTTKTTQLNISGPVAAGAFADSVLTIDTAGNVRKTKALWWDNAGTYETLANTNVIVNKDLTVKGNVRVNKNCTVDLLTETKFLKITGVLPGAHPDKVLTIASDGSVRSMDASAIHTSGFELWKEALGTLVPKSNLAIRHDKGVIMKSNPDKPNDIPQTSDLGLYSLHKGQFVRYVSNDAPHKFFTIPGLNGIGDGEPVLEIFPNYVNVTENLNLKDNQNFTIGWKFPFMVNTFKITDNGSGQDDAWYRSTGVLVDEYPVAAVIGFKTTGWVSNMGGDPGVDFFVTCRPKNGQWEIVANIGNAPGNDNREEDDWHVDVMFTYRGIVEVRADYKNRIYSV